MTLKKSFLIILLLTISIAFAGNYNPILVKGSSKVTTYFDKTNYETKDAKIPCNDLLSTYATKPKGLEFVKCERITDSQTIVRATYRVKGNKSKEIEDFLVETYGMGVLNWACCGWDNGGTYGMFEHSEFIKIDTYCSALITMYASGEVVDKSDPTKIIVETDRNNIEYFTVVVELVIV